MKIKNGTLNLTTLFEIEVGDIFLKLAVSHAENKELAECYRIEVYMIEKDGEDDEETE